MGRDMDDGVEVWESATESTVYVSVRDPRTPGAFRSQRVYGKGSGNSKLRIHRSERELIQDNIPERNKHLDPFTNGTLVCIDGRPHEPKGPYELTDDDLVGLLQITDDAVFDEVVEHLEAEVPLRRLLALAETHATYTRHERLRALIAHRYRVGGTQRTVQEMIDAGEKIGLTMLS